ncbi:MAG: response regulator [Phycisphaeraceae bacterium]
MLSRRLIKRGFEVVLVCDGESVLAAAASEAPDLILLDLSLPGIDGWELAGRIKADVSLKHIPVIALTAHAMASDRQKALDAGCDEYDTKPVDISRLLDKMRMFLTDDPSQP